MPFAPPELVLAAVDGLLDAHPLAVVTIPALLRAAREAHVDPVSGVAFGSTEETKLLNDFFSLPRPPDPERPWRAPWSAQEPWQKKKYPGGGLQRLRTDASGRGRILEQISKDAAAGRPRDIWRLLPSAGAQLMEPTKGNSKPKPIRLVDLALWFGRTQSVVDLDGLMEWFNNEFAPDHAGLVGTVYLDEIPSSYRTIAFSAEPIGDPTFEQLGSLPPAPTVAGDVIELVANLEGRLTSAGYQLPAGLVRRVLSAWLRGDLVVLVGQPGTGKTMFATLMARAMEEEFDLDAPLLIPIRADFDESEFIGYERLDGKPQYRDFANEVLLTEDQLAARVVVLEEFNLASVETYLASVLVASQERERLVRLPAGQQSHLPIDTFIIATCNSFRDEPETRTRVSSPTKRRSTTITMPNVLGDRFEETGEAAIEALTLSVLTTEAGRVSDRTSRLRAAQFDSLRASALSSVSTFHDFDEATRSALIAVCSALLNTSAGRSWFTLGLLRDVVMAIVHAERNPASELEALGQAVADKLIHQLRGTHADIQDLRFACQDLPNAQEIERLLDRVADGPSDELLPLL